MTTNTQMNQETRLDLTRPIWVSVLVILGLTAFSLWAWTQFPEGSQIPVHWNARGEVDRYGGVFEGLFLMPLILVGVTTLLYFVPKIDPKRMNIELSAKAYKATWIGTILFMGVIHVSVVMNALGYPVNIGMLVPGLVGVLFIIIGNFMGKIRSNYMFGIRTPWTLASELSWNKTHRVGGRLFMLIGLLMFISVFFPIGELWAIFLIVSVFGMVAFLFAYSYYVYQNEAQDVPS